MEGLVKLAAETKTIKPSEVHKYLKQNYPDDCIGWCKDYDWKEKKVPLSKIQMARRPGGARETDKVKGIAEAVKQGKPMEAVILVETPDGKIKIADGYHRTLGHDHADKKTIKSWIAKVSDHKGPWDKEMHEKKLNVGKKAELDLGLSGLEKSALLEPQVPQQPIPQAPQSTVQTQIPQLPKRHNVLKTVGELAGIGAAIHIAPNLAMKAVKSTETGKKALAGMFSAGVDMGRTGRKLHPNIQSLMTYGVGPESMVEYQLGHKMGSGMADFSPEAQQKIIDNGHRLNDKINPEHAEQFEKMPMLGSMKHYFDGNGENKVKNTFMKMSVPKEQPMTWKNHLGNAAALGITGAINPHLLLQPALSGTRKVIAESQVGRNIMTNAFNKGVSGTPLSKGKERAIDMLVSPSALDPYRVGKTMNQILPDQVGSHLGTAIDAGNTIKNFMQRNVQGA